MRNEDDRLLRALRDPLLWTEPTPATREGWEAIAPMLEAVQAEDAAAAALCKDVLTGPSASWPERLSRTPGTDTLGMARQLLERMPALVESRPADALQATSMAIGIVETLDPKRYWPDHLTHVRAQALRDHAFVLSCLGRCTEALAYGERAARAFEHVPVADFDLARLALVQASALLMQKRTGEAAALAHDAAEAFRRLGDRPRYVNARITEAALLYDGGAVERALEVLASVRCDDAAEQRLAHAIAVCLCELGLRQDAIELLQRRLSEYECAGFPGQRTNCTAALEAPDLVLRLSPRLANPIEKLLRVATETKEAAPPLAPVVVLERSPAVEHAEQRDRFVRDRVER